MEKILEKTQTIIDENEKIIANILHDIKSPLYSIKIGLQNKLDCELNKDIFETTLDTIKYIENFLVNYNFKCGKFENKTVPCDIKKIINNKIENYKYIFISKNICIDMILEENSFIVDSIEIFLSSIIGNIISNIAFHASPNKSAIIEIFRKKDDVFVNFENFYDSKNSNFNLGLNFCRNLAKETKTDIKLIKTKEKIKVSLRIPNIKK